MSEVYYAFPDRLRQERCRHGAARVVEKSILFTDNGLIDPGSQVEKDLIDLIRILGSGYVVPDRYYRNGIERDRDDLLERLGIKHLHLDHATSDIILFLVEYTERILLLEVGNHSRFAEKPPGSALARIHQSALKKADFVAEQEKTARVATKRSTALKGLRPRRPR